ncbi:GIY-YIG nuclease family protein [Sphaerisporangium aureirubrum]|uniref:GIY-YIG nuclease family protein n=1 Tax=Sphaerisporangium aureirubrum TaxID=1544736 RepID=A0ABW1NCK5_9ACTN
MPENAGDDEGDLSPYEATLDHIAMLIRRIDRIITTQIEAEEQLLHRAGTDYRAGRLTVESLSALYQRYRGIVWREHPGGPGYYYRPPFTWVWTCQIGLHPTGLAKLVRRSQGNPCWKPNGPNGSWCGEYPIRNGHRPPDGQSVVYVLFDAENVPCYVGSTHKIKTRLQDHARTKQFVRWAAYPCADREAAYVLEERLLAEHKPYLNRRTTR